MPLSGIWCAHRLVKPKRRQRSVSYICGGVLEDLSLATQFLPTLDLQRRATFMTRALGR